MILIVELKMMGEYEQNISIEKENKIKIIDYKMFLNFYKYFYLKQDLFIQNKEITKKDCVIIDITSVSSIFKQMEFSKGTILYDYISLKYNEIPQEDKQKFYNEYLNQIDILKEKLNINSKIIPEDSIDKVVLQNIDISIDFDNLLETFNEILNKVMKENINKTYIIFYDSKLIEIKPESDNYYLFDVNQFLDIKEYNLLISQNINELDVNYLINYIENIWPMNYEENEICFLLEHYFKYLIYLKDISIFNEKLYLIGIILNKTYNLQQKINCTNSNVNNIIKSFIDTF